MKTPATATITPAMIGCTAFAFIAAVVYTLVGTNTVSIPDLGVEEAPVAIWYIAAGCYLAGGLLVLRGRRSLWTVGLAANTFVIFIFFLAYRQEPEMMLSAAGLTTKTAQVLLEAGLIYLLAAGRNNTRSTALIQPSPTDLTGTLSGHL